MASILILDRKGNRNWTGFSFSDMASVVHYGGQARNHNGQWALSDEIDFSELAEAIDYLSEDDFEALEEMVNFRLALDAEKAEAKERGLLERIALLDTIRGESVRVKIRCDDGRNFPSTFCHFRGRLCIAFYKKGGYREWLAPVTRKQAEGVIRGTHQLRYIKSSNRFLIKDAA